MPAEERTLCYSIECQENPYNGRHSIHWLVFVQTACERRPSGFDILHQLHIYSYP